jgi:hypothetical protein
MKPASFRRVRPAYEYFSNTDTASFGQEQQFRIEAQPSDDLRQCYRTNSPNSLELHCEHLREQSYYPPPHVVVNSVLPKKSLKKY